MPRTASGELSSPLLGAPGKKREGCAQPGSVTCRPTLKKGKREGGGRRIRPGLTDHFLGEEKSAIAMNRRPEVGWGGGEKKKEKQQRAGAHLPGAGEKEGGMHGTTTGTPLIYKREERGSKGRPTRSPSLTELRRRPL